MDVSGSGYDFILIAGVALLPFVDEKRLLHALEEVYPLLTQDESKSHTRLYEILRSMFDFFTVTMPEKMSLLLVHCGSSEGCSREGREGRMGRER